MREKEVVRRVVDEVINERRLEVLDELCTPSMARHADGHRRIGRRG